MSLLLEALKKAALEKQSRENAADVGQEPLPAVELDPKLGDTLRQDDDVDPIPEQAAEKAQQEPVKDTLEIDEQWLTDDAAVQDTATEPDNSITSEATELNLDDDLADPLIEALDFEPEFESEIEPQLETVPTEPHIDTLVSGETSQPAASSELEIEQLDVSQQEMMAEIEQEADRQKLEQERLLEQEVAKQQQLREEERLRTEAQEAKAKEEAEAKEEEKRKQNAAKREKSRIAEKNRDAIDQLISSGKAIHKREKRRSAFLYLMLILTGLGGMLSYYVYQIAATEKNELRSTPFVSDDSEFVDVAALIQSTEPAEFNAAAASEDTAGDLSSLDAGSIASNIIANSLEQNSQLDQAKNQIAQIQQAISQGAISTEELSNSVLPQGLSLAAARAQIEAASGSLVDDTAANLVGTLLNSEQSQPLPTQQPQTNSGAPSNIARRVDPPPSITSYLRPLILAANGERQTQAVSERVIIHHKSAPTEINDVIKAAYSALQANQLDQADRLYRQALDSNPNQRDAVLGAAAVAIELGRFEEATALYQKRLESDPKDDYAHAGLLGLVSNSASRQSMQREVNALLSNHPKSAQLHFLKGVGLAASSQWTSAQASFYEAYSLDNVNPDYAFNLAVSLDHLNQPSLARVYYERAIELARTKSAKFDKAAANLRLAELNTP